MEKKPDILLMMSDQHAGAYTGYENGMVDTPNLNRLSLEGTRFASHYTPVRVFGHRYSGT